MQRPHFDAAFLLFRVCLHVMNFFGIYDRKIYLCNVYKKHTHKNTAKTMTKTSLMPLLVYNTVYVQGGWKKFRHKVGLSDYVAQGLT